MGIFSRFTTLMKANINDRIEKSRRPEKMIKDLLREVNLDLRTVQSELHALEADVLRAKRAVDASEAEIRKLERYKERISEHDVEKARYFETEQEKLEKEKLELLATYNRLAIDAKQLKLLAEKLTLDVHQLEDRNQIIREKAVMLEQQQKINESKRPTSSGFNSYEEELNFKLDEAEALANLRNETMEIDSIDAEFAKLDEKYKSNQ